MHARHQFAFLLMLLLLTPLGARADGDVAAQEIFVSLNSQKLLQVPSRVKSIVVGPQKIAEAKQIGVGELLVVGYAVGETALALQFEDGTTQRYQIRVRDPETVAKEIKAILGKMEHVTVRVVGHNVYIDGVAVTDEE